MKRGTVVLAVLPSVLRLGKLFTLQRGLLLGKLGELSPRLMQQVDVRLRIALGLQ